MRVIVVRDDISPAEIVHPALFQPLARGDAPVTAMLAPGKGARQRGQGLGGHRRRGRCTDAPPERRQSLRSIAAAKAAEAAAAAKKAEEARRAVVKAKADRSRLPAELRRAQAAVATAEARAAPGRSRGRGGR